MCACGPAWAVVEVDEEIGVDLHASAGSQLTRMSQERNVWSKALGVPDQATTSACLHALSETGATGLEPATSGVTGRERPPRSSVK